MVMAQTLLKYLLAMQVSNSRSAPLHKVYCDLMCTSKKIRQLILHTRDPVLEALFKRTKSIKGVTIGVSFTAPEREQYRKEIQPKKRK